MCVQTELNEFVVLEFPEGLWSKLWISRPSKKCFRMVSMVLQYLCFFSLLASWLGPCPLWIVGDNDKLIALLICYVFSPVDDSDSDGDHVMGGVTGC